MLYLCLRGISKEYFETAALISEVRVMLLYRVPDLNILENVRLCFGRFFDRW